jgi:Fur family transcriptional regulator, zinc uptake regulator
MPQVHHDHAHCTAELISRAERTCAKRGTRLTEQRKDVLARVAESHSAVGAYEIIERMATGGARPAPITIYRALDFLLDHDLVHKIESRNAYVACSGVHSNDQPTLLICNQCGVVDEVIAPATNACLENVAAEKRFAVSKTVIELSGTCNQCAAGR